MPEFLQRIPHGIIFFKGLFSWCFGWFFILFVGIYGKSGAGPRTNHLAFHKVDCSIDGGDLFHLIEVNIHM